MGTPETPSGPSLPPGRIGIGKRVLFGLLMLIVPLALVEIGVRIVLGAPEDSPLMIPAGGTEESPTQWKQSELHMADPYLIWRNKPGVDIEYKKVGVRTNRWGMRDDDFPRDKPAGEYRILSLGESTTFGSKVEQDELYGAVLERCLNERRSDATYRVMNAGTPGWTLAQSYEFLRREGLEFAPDAILLYHGFNDFLKTTMTERRTAPGEPGGRGMPDLEILEQRRRWAGSFGAWLTRNSYAIRWIVAKMKSKTAGEMNAEEAEKVTQESVRVPEADRIEILGRIRDLAVERSVALVVAIPCYRKFTDHRQVLLDFTEKDGVRRIDLEESVTRLGGDRKALFADGSHPKAALHAAFAEQICDAFDSSILSAATDED